MEDPSTYGGGLNIADSAAMAASATGRAALTSWNAPVPYAALVEDGERVVDEIGGAEIALNGLHG
jgi:hypothetical protein